MSFDWSFFAHLLFHPPGSFVQGAIRTVYLAVIAQTLGVALGLLLALWRRIAPLPLRMLRRAATSGWSAAPRCWSRR